MAMAITMAMVVTEILIHSLRPPCLRCAHYIPAFPAPALPEEGNPKVEQMFKHQQCRVGKCHGYDGYIRVKKLASWGKKFGRLR